MIYTNTLPGRTVEVEGEHWLWLSGTAYLGMGHHAGFQEFIKQGISQYGSNFGSSRNNNLRLSIYESAEAALAHFVGAPAALTVSSGMLVGQLLMQWVRHRLQYESVQYFFAPGVHPALWNEHYEASAQAPSEWFAGLPNAIDESRASTCVIATDSVGSPQVSRIDFEWIAHLPPNRKVLVLIDDSHGIGVLGAGGRGIYAQATSLLRSPLHQVVVVASLNKALGIPAGAVLSDVPTIESLRLLPMFAGSSPMSPGFAYALQRACEEDLYGIQHNLLLEKIHYFERRIAALHLFDFVENYPAYCSRHSGLHQFLRQHRILTASFAYPTPADKPVTRLVVSTLHKLDDLDQLADLCGKFMG